MDTPRLRLRSSLAATLTIIGLTLSLAAPTAAAVKTPFGTNLLKNPGFEAGSASPNGQTTVSIPHWKTFDGHGTVVKYGTAGGFPTKADAALFQGHKFFAAGPQVSDTSGSHCDTAWQAVKIKGRNAAIDQGLVVATLGVWVATFDGQSETVYVDLEFYNGNGDFITATNSQPVSATNNSFRAAAAERTMPAGTRMLRVVLLTGTHAGAYCDGYFDSAYLQIGEP